MYYTEDNSSSDKSDKSEECDKLYIPEEPPYDSKEVDRLACCSVMIIVGFTLLIASLAGWFSVSFLRGN